MSRRILRSYVRTARLKWGLSQAELGALIGVSDDVIGNCERGRTAPSSTVVLGCTMLFGVRAGELFPAVIDDLQDHIGRQAAALDVRLRNRTDAGAHKKLALLRAFAARSVENLEI